jgi:ribosomal protein S24E
VETKKDFSNKLLKRRELEVVLVEEQNPGFDKVKKEVAQEFKSNEENVVIKKLKNGFGSNEFVVDAFIYDDVASRDAIEPKKKEKRKKEGQ